MAGCYFRATGDAFDVDAFLAGSSLEPDDVYHKGEPMIRPDKPRPFTGFAITICDFSVDLRPQVAEAISFLREAEFELSRLAGYPGVTEMLLDFPYQRREGAAIQSDSLPPELLSLAGSLGITIELTLYPNEKEWDEMFKTGPHNVEVPGGKFMKLSNNFSGALRTFAYFMSSGTHHMLEGVDYLPLYGNEPSAIEQAYAIFANVLELGENGQVLNARHAEKRATDYFRAYCDPNFKVHPLFEDWETKLHV